MNNKKLITICVAIIAIAIIVCGIISVYNAHEVQKELNKPVIYNNTIEGVGTFQSVNATNFTNIKDDGTGQVYYKSNLTGAEISVCDKDKKYFDINLLQGEKVNDTPKGHTIYKTHATVGESAGEVRYTAVIYDNDNNRIILISSPDKNLTDMMVDSFKVLQPVTKQEVKNTNQEVQKEDSSDRDGTLKAQTAREEANKLSEKQGVSEETAQKRADAWERQARTNGR